MDRKNEKVSVEVASGVRLSQPVVGLSSYCDVKSSSSEFILKKVMSESENNKVMSEGKENECTSEVKKVDKFVNEEKGRM